jgi:hypothetical protein
MPGNSEDHKRTDINDPYSDFKKANTGGYAKRPAALDAIHDSKSYPAAKHNSDNKVASASTSKKSNGGL